MVSKPSVFIVNKSSHNFHEAENYGNLIYLSEGSINRYATNNMYRAFIDRMKDATPDDYIVPCSLNVMNSIACAIFARRFGRLNLLLFKNGNYVERNLIIEE